MFKSKHKIKKNIFSLKLSEATYYEKAIDKLHQKLTSQSNHLIYENQPDGINFAQIYVEKNKISRLLAREVSNNDYVFSEACLSELRVKDKIRKIYQFTLFDRIVHHAVFQILYEDFQHFFSDHIYSYIKGRSRIDAINAFTNYTKLHCKRTIEKKHRGFYVHRFDIKSYGESIPVSPDSLIWKTIEQLFMQVYGAGVFDAHKNLLESLIRPAVANDLGGASHNVSGIPDGSPITALLLNLYVKDLDQEVAKIRGSFYGRYGDDIIFAHENHAVFVETIKLIDDKLNELKLTKNLSKTRSIFFNFAGRECGGFRGSTAIEYLGMQIFFDGTIALKKDKISDLMNDIKKRVKATHQLVDGYDLHERAKIVVEIINQALNPRNPLANPYSELLLGLVNDRGQLKDIDYWIARLVLHTVTGDPSVKKFRTISYKRIRNDWGLVSLEHIRNK